MSKVSVATRLGGGGEIFMNKRRSFSRAKARKLSEAQKEALLSATKELDYCLRVKGPLKQALLDRDLIKDTQGFGWKYGGIQELTEKGRIEQQKLIEVPK